MREIFSILSSYRMKKIKNLNKKNKKKINNKNNKPNKNMKISLRTFHYKKKTIKTKSNLNSFKIQKKQPLPEN